MLESLLSMRAVGLWKRFESSLKAISTTRMNKIVPESDGPHRRERERVLVQVMHLIRNCSIIFDASEMLWKEWASKLDSHLGKFIISF